MLLFHFKSFTLDAMWRISGRDGRKWVSWVEAGLLEACCSNADEKRWLRLAS